MEYELYMVKGRKYMIYGRFYNKVWYDFDIWFRNNV